MSSTNVRRVANTRSAVEYELYGIKGTAKYRENIKNGTTRSVAVTHDQASIEEYLLRAEALAEANGRKIESRSIIQSFAKDEFDPDNPEDVQRVNDLGYMFAKELHPNSDVLVITHTDGCGGHPHNHIKVLNHDNVTGKALRGGDMHWQFNAVNDRVMEREGHRIIAPEHTKEKETQKQQKSYWEHQRDAEGVTAFDQQLGDNIIDSLADPKAVDVPSYKKLLAEKGIELIEKETQILASSDGSNPAHMSTGWTYKMVDKTGEKPRTRRRAASKLSDEFTHKGAHEIFDLNRERKAKHDERQRQNRAAGSAAAARGINIDSELAAAASARVDLGDVERLELDGLSTGGPVTGGRGGGGRAERDGAAAEDAVDLSGANHRLLAAAERGAEGQQQDRPDDGSDERSAVEQQGSAPAGRKPREPVKPGRPLLDDKASKRDTDYDCGR